MSSHNWTRNTTLVDIVGGNYYLYKGALLGQTAGMCFYDKYENIVGFLTSPNNGTTTNDVVSSVEFLAPIGATKMSFCFFKSEITSLSDIGIFSIIKEIDYDNPKIKEVFAEQEYDVCIVGGGAGGIGSAYALKNSGLRVCLIEKDNMLYSPWNSPGQNAGVGRLSLLQGIFLTQGSNPGLLHCRWILYQLSHHKLDSGFRMGNTCIPMANSF